MKYLFLILFLGGCTKPPLQITQTDNAEFQAEFLFKHDGCKIYRFHDAGYSHYFTNCTSVTSTRDEACGKGCTRHVEELIGGGKLVIDTHDGGGYGQSGK